MPHYELSSVLPGTRALIGASIFTAAPLRVGRELRVAKLPCFFSRAGAPLEVQRSDWEPAAVGRSGVASLNIARRLKSLCVALQVTSAW